MDSNKPMETVMKCGCCKTGTLELNNYQYVCPDCGRIYPDIVKNPAAYERYVTTMTRRHTKADYDALREAGYGNNMAMFGLSTHEGSPSWEEIEKKHRDSAVEDCKTLWAQFLSENA